MSEFWQNIFYAFVAEIFVVLTAWLVKEDKRKQVLVLTLGTTIAGTIGFGPTVLQRLSASPADVPAVNTLPTSSQATSEVPSVPSMSPANSNESESFPNSTIRHISLNSGELLVGAAVRFAIRAFGCNTMDINENIHYTVFLLRGPLEVDVEINDGGWDYWVDVYNENFAKSLLEPKRIEVEQLENYAVVGHTECIIPPFK